MKKKLIKKLTKQNFNRDMQEVFEPSSDQQKEVIWSIVKVINNKTWKNKK